MQATPVSLEDESKAASLCREFDTKAVLLVKLLPPEIKRDPQSVLGPVTVAEVTIQAIPVRPGSPLEPHVFQGKYIDPRNNPTDFIVRRAFEDAVKKAAEDLSLSAALGLPKR